MRSRRSKADKPVPSAAAGSCSDPSSEPTPSTGPQSEPSSGSSSAALSAVADPPTAARSDSSSELSSLYERINSDAEVEAESVAYAGEPKPTELVICNLPFSTLGIGTEDDDLLRWCMDDEYPSMIIEFVRQMMNTSSLIIEFSVYPQGYLEIALIHLVADLLCTKYSPQSQHLFAIEVLPVLGKSTEGVIRRVVQFLTTPSTSKFLNPPELHRILGLLLFHHVTEEVAHCYYVSKKDYALILILLQMYAKPEKIRRHVAQPYSRALQWIEVMSVRLQSLVTWCDSFDDYVMKMYRAAPKALKNRNPEEKRYILRHKMEIPLGRAKGTDSTPVCRIPEEVRSLDVAIKSTKQLALNFIRSKLNANEKKPENTDNISKASADPQINSGDVLKPKKRVKRKKGIILQETAEEAGLALIPRIPDGHSADSQIHTDSDVKAEQNPNVDRKKANIQKRKANGTAQVCTTPEGHSADVEINSGSEDKSERHFVPQNETERPTEKVTKGRKCFIPFCRCPDEHDRSIETGITTGILDTLGSNGTDAMKSYLYFLLAERSLPHFECFGSTEKGHLLDAMGMLIADFLTQFHLYFTASVFNKEFSSRMEDSTKYKSFVTACSKRNAYDVNHPDPFLIDQDIEYIFSALNMPMDVAFGQFIESNYFNKSACLLELLLQKASIGGNVRDQMDRMRFYQGLYDPQQRRTSTSQSAGPSFVPEHIARDLRMFPYAKDQNFGTSPSPLPGDEEKALCPISNRVKSPTGDFAAVCQKWLPGGRKKVRKIKAKITKREMDQTQQMSTQTQPEISHTRDVSTQTDPESLPESTEKRDPTPVCAPVLTRSIGIQTVMPLREFAMGLSWSYIAQKNDQLKCMLNQKTQRIKALTDQITEMTVHFNRLKHLVDSTRNIEEDESLVAAQCDQRLDILQSVLDTANQRMRDLRMEDPGSIYDRILQVVNPEEVSDSSNPELVPDFSESS